MNPPTRSMIALSGLALLAGCAARQPVLYRNTALLQQDPAVVEARVDECLAAGEAYDRTLPGAEVVQETFLGSVVGAAGGAVGGAIWGNAGIGAASGAAAGAVASLMNQALRPHDPSPGFRAGVSRCLQEQGYEVIAWQ